VANGKRGGRLPGVPNKATRRAREAIALLVEGNIERLQGWLDEIAEGRRGKDGGFIVPPNPIKAFELLQSLLEYHVPKLSRAEMTVQDNPIETDDISDLELARRILFDLHEAERAASRQSKSGKGFTSYPAACRAGVKVTLSPEVAAQRPGIPGQPRD
jgi:hypothetical protein